MEKVFRAWIEKDNYMAYQGEPDLESLVSFTVNTVKDGKHGQEKTILEKAQEIIYGEREKDYGTVTENFGRIANLWTAYLNGRSEINPSDVGMMMVLMKVARQANGHKEDNLIDIAGYCGCVEKLNRGL